MKTEQKNRVRLHELRDELADFQNELEKLYEYWCCDSCHGDDEVYLENRIEGLEGEIEALQSNLGDK